MLEARHDPEMVLQATQLLTADSINMQATCVIRSIKLVVFSESLL